MQLIRTIILILSILVSGIYSKIQGDSLCSNDLDCSLVGECQDGSCVCDPGWKGKSCDMLDVQKSPVDAGYRNATGASWGGNVIYEDGKYHMFVAQFVNHCQLDVWGTASSIVRAEADSPDGPFVMKETVIKPFAHNPTVRRGFDGYFYLFMIGAGDSEEPPDCTDGGGSVSSIGDDEPVASAIHVSHSESIRGPWSEPAMIEFSSTSKYLAGGWTNPSPHFNPDGTVHLAFQAGFSNKGPLSHGHALVGIAIADSPFGPYKYLTEDPVTPMDWDPIHPVCWAGVDEDPFLWRSKRGFHILTHGMCPSGVRQAHYKYSADGVNWHTSPRQTYRYTVRYENGRPDVLARVERPQLYFDGGYDLETGLAGSPIVLYNGVCGGEFGNGTNYECAFDKLTGMTWTLARRIGDWGTGE